MGIRKIIRTIWGLRGKVQTRVPNAVLLAKQQLDRAFFGLNRVGRGIDPQGRQCSDTNKDAATADAGARATARAAITTLTTASAHQDFQLLLALSDKIVDFGDLWALWPTVAATIGTVIATRTATVSTAAAPWAS